MSISGQDVSQLRRIWGAELVNASKSFVHKGNVTFFTQMAYQYGHAAVKSIDMGEKCR